MPRLFQQYPDQKFVQGIPTNNIDFTGYAKTAGGILPGIGEVISAYDTYKSLQEGNYGEAGLNALGLLPFVPSLGGITKNVSKETKDLLSKYFDKTALEAIDEPLDYKSRETVVLMSPDDFLSYASKFEGSKPNKGKMADIEKRFAKGDKLPASNLPYLQFNTEKGVSKITGHEGRHRATYLKNQGVDLIPVRVKSSDIRWDQQANPENFDYIENWPSQLQNQDAVWQSPFPFSREGEYASTVNQQQTVPDTFWNDPTIKAIHTKQEIEDLAKELEDFIKYKDPFGDTTK